MWHYVWYSIIVITVIVVLLIVVPEFNDCSAQGGQMVRGIFGYVCVK